MRKKEGFTFFETLIVITIASLLVLLSFKIFRTADEKAYSKLYAKAFNTLNVATYNIQKDVDDYNAEQDLKAQENEGKAGADDSEKKRFPYVNCTGSSCEDTAVTEAQLCDALVKDDRGYINVVGTPSCKVFAMSDFTTAEEPPEEPSFKTTDGMNFYLTSSPDALNYIVWVDISGDRRPNSARFVTGKKRPDIVPFSIFKDTGVVVPQGYPIFDPTYMTARVVSANPDIDFDYSIPMTFYEARSVAYSGKHWTLDRMSWGLDSYFQDTKPDDFFAPTPDSSITNELKCNENMALYDSKRDFPPCSIEVSTFMQK